MEAFWDDYPRRPNQNDSLKIPKLAELLDINISAYEKALPVLQKANKTTPSSYMVVDLVEKYLDFLRHTRQTVKNISTMVAPRR